MPCLAQERPQAAITMPAAVETLKVSMPSPPVPTMSMTRPRSSLTTQGFAKLLIASAHAQSTAGSSSVDCTGKQRVVRSLYARRRLVIFD